MKKGIVFLAMGAFVLCAGGPAAAQPAPCDLDEQPPVEFCRCFVEQLQCDGPASFGACVSGVNVCQNAEKTGNSRLEALCAEKRARFVEECGVECIDDEDCVDGEICIDNACVPLVP